MSRDLILTQNLIMPSKGRLSGILHLQIVILRESKKHVVLLYRKAISRKSSKKTMAENDVPTLSTLPLMLVFRVLDHFDPLEILISFSGASSRLNTILGAYHPFQVKFSSARAVDTNVSMSRFRTN